MKQCLLNLAIALLISISFSYGQNTFPSSGSTGIGTTTPNISSLLEVNSTTKGILTPRMTTAQRNAIGTPAQGLMIFQTDGTPGFYYYNSGWKAVTTAVSGFAAKSLNNLTTTAINLDLLPRTTSLWSLGSSTLSWKDVYLGGDVYLDGTRFVSNYPGTVAFNVFVGSNSGKAITTGKYNTAVGQNAMLSTTSGYENIALGANTLYSNTTGYYNTATGRGSLYFNTSGSHNTANGWKALNNNIIGNFNVALGSQALYNNTSSYNVAVGFQALLSNTSGYNNTATGVQSLYQNIGGSSNTGDGNYSLANNSSGTYNTGIGQYALYANTVDYYNTAIGYSAGDFVTGSNNTFIGALAYPNNNGFSNSSSLGYDSHNTASNQIVLGSSSVSSIISGSGFIIYSDGRFKKNRKENVPGLEFINLLKPVTYTYDVHALDKKLKGNASLQDNAREDRSRLFTDTEEKAMLKKEKIVYTGFIAQEVEAAANKVNYDFSGVYKPQNDNDVYGLSYADFVIPLVKAVQELDAKDKNLEDENKELKEEMASLKQIVMDLKNGVPNRNLSGASSYLEQNTPNPSSAGTSIRYHVPLSATSVNITITNIKGQLMKTIRPGNNGTGEITINSASWAAGTYNYSLWIDGKQADTKRLVITR